MHEIDLTAKVKNIIRFTLPTLIVLAAIIGYAEFRYWHKSETVRLDDAKVSGTMVSVRVLTNGKVKEILFDDGAQVQAGDVIARLEVSITDEEIKQLENTVQLAKDQYARLQEGQWVKVAVQRERVTYKETQSTSGGGGSSGNLAKLEERANRMAELFEMGAVSAVQRDAARRAYESALAESSPSTSSSSEPVVEYYTEYVDEFRPTPPEVLAGAEQAIKQAELSLNVARQEARETDVIAPVSGAIYYGVEPETDLSAGDFVARIGDKRELWVEAAVTEEIFDKIPLGKLATVTIDGKEFFGTVMEKIKPNVTAATDDEDAQEPMELPEIPDATNKPAPLIGENPSQQPTENSTPEQPKPKENSAETQAQSPPEETPAPENQAAQSTETQPAENQTPPTENQSANQTPENSSTDTQQPETPKTPKIPVAETQPKPNDKFIIKISLPVEHDVDFKPGTAVTVEIKL